MLGAEGWIVLGTGLKALELAFYAMCLLLVPVVVGMKLGWERTVSVFYTALVMVASAAISFASLLGAVVLMVEIGII